MVNGIIELIHDLNFDRMFSLSSVWIMITRDLILEDNGIFSNCLLGLGIIDCGALGSTLTYN
jgi:hypothetical protein